MDRLNVSIPSHLAGFVRSKVKSGRYSDVSEVVREALRRMEDEENRELRLGGTPVEDIVAVLPEPQRHSIKQRVLAGMDAIERGEFTEYEGPEGLQALAAGVKAKGRAAVLARRK